MALSGSLNFISASVTGSANIKVDFVGLNTLIVDPLTASSNDLGYPHSMASTVYYNSLVEAQAGPEPNQLNSLLLHRNGPYQHPMWKQYRGAEHPVARNLRLNNTMSVDSNNPNAKAYQNKKLSIEASKDSYIFGQTDNSAIGGFPGCRPGDHQIKEQTPDFSSLKRYYEPSIVSTYKPLIYTVKPPNMSTPVKARQSLINQMTYFTNEELNTSLKIASADPTTGNGGILEGFQRPNQRLYEAFRAASANNAYNYIYSERLFPKEVNAYRNYKLVRANYEETATSTNGWGRSANGYNRPTGDPLLRSFWKDDQGGGHRATSDGTTRMRSNFEPLNGGNLSPWCSNTQDVKQMLTDGRVDYLFDPASGSRRLFDSSSSPPWNSTVEIYNSVVNNQINNMTSSITGADSKGNIYPKLQPSGAFSQLEMFQAYGPSTLSMWPLDPRDDIYDSPAYLTTSLGGRGLSIGAAPHRLTASLSSYNYTSAQMQDALTNIATGSAGELVYSSKTTMFLWRPENQTAPQQPTSGEEGFEHNYASLQYHRHTFPYNSPFFATHKIRGRNPMYNSYNDFIGNDLKYLGRDYAILPEYTINDHLEYYCGHGLFPSHLAPGYTLGDQSFEIAAADLVFSYSPIERSIVQTFKKEYSIDMFKQDFLKIAGGGNLHAGAHPGPASSSAHHTNLHSFGGKTTRFYNFDPIAGSTAYTSNAADWSYKALSASVDFYEQYSHAEAVKNMSFLMHQGTEGFDQGINTIPTAIKFTCRGLKKLLPYNGFYPVTRTVQIGRMFNDAYAGFVEGDALAATGSYDKEPANAAYHLGPMKNQSIAEPFMAPGILYNSIKSGLAVDYPIFIGDNQAQPYYYLPQLFITASHLSQSAPYKDAFSDQRVNSKASASFNYGGCWMLGSSRCTPAILNKRPTHRLPFEALLDPSILRSIMKNVAGDISNKHLYLVTDFVDFDRSDIGDITSSVLDGRAHPTYNSGSDVYFPGSHAGTAVPAIQPRIRLNIGPGTKPTTNIMRYKSAVNNFLCEMMDFFLEDIDPASPGVKLPIIASTVKSRFTPSPKIGYFMDVTLRMGKYHVGCEGPRHASMGGGSPVDNIYTRNAMMRGYLYGPPIEYLAQAEQSETSVTEVLTTYEEGGGAPETTVATTGAIGRTDYQSYYGANLQDPAYQAYTPPYFYGQSSIYFKYVVPTPKPATITIDVQEVLNTILDKTDASDTVYYERYDTGSYKGDIDALCLTVPELHTVSIGSLTRTKVDSSVDISPNALKITKTDSDVQHYVSYVAPKWVCPVLDFSSSSPVVVDRVYDPVLDKFGPSTSTLTNTYHDITTGRGLWGGYGIDPYDDEVLAKMNIESEKKDKGVYLSVGYPFLQSQTTAQQTYGYTTPYVESGDDFYSSYARAGSVGGTETTNPALTASLAQQLGFSPSESRAIGRFAAKKDISEAVVIIPYFENSIEVKPRSGLIIEGSDGTPDVFSTREIIPGKHFLPINRSLFKRLLAIHLEQNPVWSDSLTMAVPGSSTQGSFVQTASPLAINRAKSTDVYRMIELLAGVSAKVDMQIKKSTSTVGYQLPPEFDFIFNSAIDPFQMVVIPIDHKLYKQELIDIYQGIMPRSSIDLERVVKSMVVNPRPSMFEDDNPWYPGANENLSQLALAQFLTPAVFLESNSGLIDRSTLPDAIKSSADFYKNVKFMIFKAKQRAKKDYPIYRNKQIAKYVRDKRLVNPDFKSEQIDRYLSAISRTEIQGANWPYDYFSLLQSAKIDISFLVDGTTGGGF